MAVDNRSTGTELKDKFSLDYHTGTGKSRFIVYKFLQRYYVGSNTHIFSIPNDKSDEKNFSILSRLNSDRDYEAYIYDVDEFYNAAAAVIPTNESIEMEENVDHFMVVESLRQAVNDAGDRILKIVGVYNGAKTELLVNNDSDLATSAAVREGEPVEGRWGYSGTKVSELKFGDVIQFSKNSVGYVSAFRILHRNEAGELYYYKRSSNPKVVGSLENFAHMATVAIYNEIVRTDGKAFVIDKDNEKTMRFTGDRFPITVTICDTQNNRVVKGTSSDIFPQDRVVLMFDWSSAKDLVVYR